jgi:hypothetical protein
VANKINNDIQPEKTSSIGDSSFADFLRQLFKKWFLFMLIGLFAGIAGFFYAKFQDPVYESNLTFVLDEGGSNSGIGGALNFAAHLGFNFGGSTGDMFSGDNIIEIIKSRRIIENVFLSTEIFEGKQYTIIEYYLYKLLSPDKMEKYKNVHFNPGQQRESFTYLQDSLMYGTYATFVKSAIEIDRPDKKLGIFSLRVTTANEKFTKIFTDRLIHAADSLYTEISSKKGRETLEILEKRVADMKGNLSSSITNRASVQDANVNPAFSSAQIPVQKQQANIQVYGGAYAEMFKSLEMARFQYLNKMPLIQIIDRADYPMKKIKTGKVKTALIFSLSAVFVFALVLWLIRVYRLKS